MFDVTTSQSVGSCFAAQGQSIECFLFSGAAIDPGDQVRITFSGVTNPSSVGSADAVGLHDLRHHPGDLALLQRRGQQPDHRGDGRDWFAVGCGVRADPVRRRVHGLCHGWVVGGGQQPDDGDVPGRHRVGRCHGAVFDITTNQSVGCCFAAQGQSIECFLFSGAVIDPGDQVRITFSGVTNPSSAGSRTLSVFTTSDTTPVTSPSYTVVANNPLTGVTAAIGSPSAAASAQDPVRRRASRRLPRVGCRRGANSRMTVTFPAGTGLVGVNGAVFDVTTGQSVGSCFAAQGQSIECFLFSGAVIDPGDQVRITFSGVTNPSSAGSRTLAGLDDL